MSFRASVSHKNLDDEEEEGYRQKIHELFVIFLEHYRAVLLVLHSPDVLNYRIETELAVACADI